MDKELKDNRELEKYPPLLKKILFESQMNSTSMGKGPHVSDVKVILKIWVHSRPLWQTLWEQLLEMDKEA